MTESLCSAFCQTHTELLCDQERKKLSDAWSTSAASKVLFVSIEVDLLNSQGPDISEIVLSFWSPGTSRDIQTLLWVLDTGIFNIKEHRGRKISDIEYERAKLVPLDEISAHLDEVFRNFRRQYERIFLVGYKVNNTLSLIGNVWVPPEGTETIDTERAWRSQHNSKDLTFKQCIEGVPELHGYSSSLEDVGVKAELDIRLLQAQAEIYQQNSQL
ncbi:hypothetical protein RRF57_009241 [Xylaria bambusicola]|uniref:Uncharacterized protein n=1 Tax=Xylaria bambusicola TaxID=326684 RepID=A0AAN7Z7P9_9PEZI